MSATVVTQSNNPTLWQTLMDEWESWKNPGWVENSNYLYKVENLSNGTTQFRLMEALEYLDSRSFTVSRKASYKNSVQKY